MPDRECSHRFLMGAAHGIRRQVLISQRMQREFSRLGFQNLQEGFELSFHRVEPMEVESVSWPGLNLNLLRQPDAGGRPVPSREEGGIVRDASLVLSGPYCPFLYGRNY
ncbi:hypothetical protein PO909_002326 [Leuciscus waleckii]